MHDDEHAPHCNANILSSSARLSRACCQCAAIKQRCGHIAEKEALTLQVQWLTTSTAIRPVFTDRPAVLKCSEVFLAPASLQHCAG